MDGLRVADASVMPALPSGNCHTTVVMIAEWVAQFIADRHGAAHHDRTAVSRVAAGE